MIRPKTYIKLVFIALLPLFFDACNPARKLTEGEHLLVKNKVIDKDTELPKSDIESYIKQKPNRTIFKFLRFHLWLHNLVNEDRVRQKRSAHNAKVEKRNERRIARGKQAKKNDRQLFGEWVLDISEAPVVYDSMLVKKSSLQIKSLLNKKGYFISSVHDSVYYGKRKKAKVYYTIKADKPYTINKLSYVIPDEQLKYFVFADTSNTLILKGGNYDEDVLQKERERITANLNNSGYYLFTKDYIYYKIYGADDSTGNRKVSVVLGIKNFAAKYIDESDSIVESPHQRFYINNVYIQPDYVSNKFDATPKDTLIANDYYFLHTQKLRYKTRMLLNTIFIRKGELYQLKNVQDTYKRLQEIKSFKTINISFIQKGLDHLDCYLQLSPILKQSYTIETEGKNTSGNLGIGGSVVYQNRNLLKGAELFELKLKGSLEAQKTIDNSSSISPSSQFNTVEIGPEANVYIPRFLIPFKVHITKQANPKTIFTSSLTYQQRPDYIRYITNVSMGYTWKQTQKLSHIINPIVINFVKVNLRPEFYDYLVNVLQNRYILNSFSNHLSTSTRYSFTYNEQDLKKLGNFFFFKFNVESSGNILRGAYDLINKIQPNTFEKNQDGGYTIDDIAFSQYVRTDFDFRYYYTPNEYNKVVWRFAAGIGKPFVNFTSLPYERSFYSGGANGIRAWQSRTLGPGSYANDGQFKFDQFGDGQLEFNLEYRVKMIKQLNGALFVDGGNTWLRQPDVSRPGGDFAFNRFYKEIALGSGVGLRADFNFFIIRFDLGIKVRDPQFAETNRWVIQHSFDADWKEKYQESHNGTKYGFLAFNIGIGYPF